MAIKLFPGFVLAVVVWAAFFPFPAREEPARMPVLRTPVPRKRVAADRVPREPAPLRETSDKPFSAAPAVSFANVSFAKAVPASSPSDSSRASPPASLLDSILFSTSAFASLKANSDEDAPYPELPAKGIAVHAGGGRFRERQQLRDRGNNVYSREGALYSLSLEYDWSADSVVGASVDILDSTVKSLYDADPRENRIQGYAANANYRGTLFGMFPVEANAFYGWLDHEGSGETARPGTGMTYPWKEDTHHSNTYGFSAKAGLPLLFLDSLKVMPSVGVRYAALTTKGYSVDIGTFNPMPMRIPEMKSTSIAVPLGVTAGMDFPQVWGIVTPRVGGGVEVEFDESASGVRALHSSAASHVDIGMDMMGITRMSPIRFDAARELLYNVNLGLDVKTVGGWEISAEYMRNWMAAYTRDDFKLEIGRCF